MLREIRWTKMTDTVWYHLYVEYKKYKTNQWTQQRRNRLKENKLMVNRGEREVGKEKIGVEY